MTSTDVGILACLALIVLGFAVAACIIRADERNGDGRRDRQEADLRPTATIRQGTREIPSRHCLLHRAQLQGPLHVSLRPLHGAVLTTSRRLAAERTRNPPSRSKHCDRSIGYGATSSGEQHAGWRQIRRRHRRRKPTRDRARRTGGGGLGMIRTQIERPRPDVQRPPRRGRIARGLAALHGGNGRCVAERRRLLLPVRAGAG